MSTTVVVLLFVVLVLAIGAAFALLYQFMRKQQVELHAKLTQLEQNSSSPAEMEAMFTKLTNASMQSQGEQVANRVQSDVSLILDPIKAEVNQFRQSVENLLESNTQSRTVLEEKFRQMDHNAARLGDEAQELSAALRGSSKQRGDWGEMTLVRTLEAVGLTEGPDGGFEQQLSFTDSDGRVLRPDVVLHLPGDRHVVIDAKVSLVAYTNYVATEDAAAQQQHLREMQTAMAKQVDEIRERYLKLPELNTLGFALMYTPLEPAWQLAMTKFPKLFDEARRAGVIICGPTTLLSTLRLAEQIWRAERSASSVREIIDRAERLQDAVVRMAEKAAETSKQLNRAAKSFDELVDKNINGRQGVLTHSRKISELGAKSKKPLPDRFNEESMEENNKLVVEQEALAITAEE